MKLILAILSAFCLGAAGPPGASAASAHFFWAGFDVQESVSDESGLERKALERALTPRFGAPESGALHSFLGTLSLDFLDYWGAGPEALAAVDRRSSFENVYGVFLSIDRLLRFEPSELEAVVSGIAPIVQRQYFWFALGGLNVFSVESRNIVYSRPVLLGSPSDDGFALAPPDVNLFILSTLEIFARELEDPANDFTSAMRGALQTYLGGPGEDAVAERSRRGHSQETYGIVDVAPIAITGTPPEGEILTPPMRARLNALTRFYFSMQLSRFELVAPVFEQQDKVAEAARGIVVEGRRGHVSFDYDEGCLPGFRRTGEYVFCVSIPPPRHAVRLAPRVDVSEEGGHRRYRSTVVYEIEEPGATVERRLEGSVSYRRPRPPLEQRLYDRPYGFAIANAISSLERPAGVERTTR